MRGRRPGQVLSGVVVVLSTHRGGLVPRVYTERSDRASLGDYDLVCNEEVLSRGRGRGVHITPLFFFETCDCMPKAKSFDLG